MAFSTISTIASTLRNTSSVQSKPPYSGPYPPAQTYSSANFYFPLNGNTQNSTTGSSQIINSSGTSFASGVGGIRNNSLLVTPGSRLYTNQFVIQNAANQSGCISFWYYRNDPWPSNTYWPHIFDYNPKGREEGSASINARICLQNAISNRRFYFVAGSLNNAEQVSEIHPLISDELANLKWTFICVNWSINSSRTCTFRLFLNANLRATLSANNMDAFSGTDMRFPNYILNIGAQTNRDLQASNITANYAHVAYFTRQLLVEEMQAIIYEFLP